MNDGTRLLRQVHPNFMKNGLLTSQAFFPFPKDKGALSVYDSDQIDAQAAYEHYTKTLQRQSHGVWGVSCGEVAQTGLTSAPDPLQDFPCHALIHFGAATSKECRKLAKRLKDFAEMRGCLFSPARP